jgi:hypothetical protein
MAARVSDLEAVQRGATVLLKWPAPQLVNQPSSRDYIERVDVYRLAERRDDEPLLDPDDYEDFAEVIGFIERSAIEEQVKSTGHLLYQDRIEMGGGLQELRLRYAVRYLNHRGQRGAFSNTVAVEPVAQVARPPTALQAAGTAQDEVVVSWTPPEDNVDGTRPASIVGYNIYRRTGGRGTASQPLNSEPLLEPSYTDSRFQYRVEYIYVVRALSRGRAGLIESEESQPVTLTPIDKFAPSPPDPVSIASANVVISLFWPTSPERDVIGYNVYRAESPDAPDRDWVKLTDQPSSLVTFRDDRVAIGRRYFYQVTAVDRFGNESRPARVVSETANP